MCRPWGVAGGNTHIVCPSQGQRGWPSIDLSSEWWSTRAGNCGDPLAVNSDGQLQWSTLRQHTFCLSGPPASTQTRPADFNAKHGGQS